MTKQIIRLDEKHFNELVMGAVKETLRNQLNEDWDDYGDDSLDDYTQEYLDSLERKDKTANQSMEKSADNKVDKAFVTQLFNTDMGSLFDYDFDDETEEESDDVQSGVSGSGNVLYDKAMEALTTTNGTISFNEWWEEVQDNAELNDAKQAFNSAKKDFDSYDVDDANDFSDRDTKTPDSTTQNQAEHKAGNVIEYDGIQITDDGEKFTMVAKEDNPRITIMGSDLKEVEGTYEQLWNNFSRMEQIARNMGFTEYHGAWLWANDYDKFVRAAGAHEENLPIVIDLDRVKGRGIRKEEPKVQQNRNNVTKAMSVPSWVEPYQHSNGKYLITKFQFDNLSDEQKQTWNKLAMKYPGAFEFYQQSR